MYVYNLPMSQKYKELPTPSQRHVCWLALSSLCLVFMIVLVACILYGFGYVFISLEPVLLPLIIAGILAYLLNPCVKWVQSRIHRRLPAVLLVLLGTFVGLGVLGMVDLFLRW